MSSLSNIPKQSYFSAQLDSPIDATQTSGIYLTTVPSYTPSGETVYLNIVDSGGPETISCTGWNTSTKELSGVTRGVDTYTGESASGSPHGAGITVVLSDDWNYFQAIATAVNTKFDTAGGTFTGAVDFSGASTTFRMPNLTTTQRDALGSPANGMIIYNTTSGTFQYYDGGTWYDVGTATVSNASETVAGIVELATNAEMGTGTSSGGTGARLVPPNDQLVKTSSGAGDENKIAVLNSFGQYADGFLGLSTSSIAYGVPKAGAAGAIDDGYIALTTAGDTVYSDGTDLTRLAIGSARQVLAVNSGATAPEWAYRGSVGNAVNDSITVTTSEETKATVSLPANVLGTANSVKIVGHVKISNATGGDVTYTLRVKYGGTTITTVTLSTVNTGTNTFGRFDLTLSGDASTSAQQSTGLLARQINGTAGVVLTDATSAIDSTSAQDVILTTQASIGSSSGIVQYFEVYVI